RGRGAARMRAADAAEQPEKIIGQFEAESLEHVVAGPFLDPDDESAHRAPEHLRQPPPARLGQRLEFRRCRRQQPGKRSEIFVFSDQRPTTSDKSPGDPASTTSPVAAPASTVARISPIRMRRRKRASAVTVDIPDPPLSGPKPGTTPIMRSLSIPLTAFHHIRRKDSTSIPLSNIYEFTCNCCGCCH